TLSHEVTHCKRGDLWIKAVCLLARTFHWFNPLVHLAAFRCEMEMELSCDEAVLAGCDENARAAYGEVMLDIIKRCRRNRGALTTHFNPKKNAVKARFTNILYGSGKKRGLWLIAVCLVLCLIAGAIVACRTEGDDVQETLTEPLPDGETVEIPLIYKQYTPERSQDMFVEEIQKTELTEILQDQELCGVRVILYLDENELFCAAYERDDTLFRFIRTGGVEPVSYDAEEFSDILEADGFTVSWSWSHRFRTYFTVEDGAPALYLDAYDNVTEADYDNDGVTEVICQNMTNVDIYDISDGTLQTVSFDSELIRPKPGEFYRYLPEKNWFEFDYKKDGEDTLFHRYGTVQDGILTLVTPDETIDTSESGEFPTMEAYVTDRMAKETTAQYFAAEPDGSFSNQQKTANVTDTKLLRLEKKGELADLAPEGTLECWEYKYLIKLDVPTEEVMIVGGQQEEDGWFDLEGQGNHTTVALRYPDGTYTVLRDDVVADGIDFTGYRNSYEEAIYDWYVTEYGLDLPLYVQDWINEITLPETDIMGNKPVHRFDGDGWGVYIPISTWYQSTDAMENQWLWRSSYNTGSTLMVDVFSHSLEDEYVTAEKQGYTPADSTNRVWENHTDGLHSCYYYYENPNGGFWRVTIEWTDEGVTNDNANIVIEPQILKLMAEKFVVFGAGEKADNAVTVTSDIYLCDDVYRGD
ncbi:MAG: M56 family metallopeptidase, partial [Clostridia bacterium]|nr:M56 family metallopeptidase [Clostridia bacterium]